MTTGGWSAALDEFASCLQEQERLLGLEQFERITAFVPPAELGALPAELAEEARGLALRAEALVSRVERATASTARRLALTRHLASPADVVRPAYLDAHF